MLSVAVPSKSYSSIADTTVHRTECWDGGTRFIAVCSSFYRLFLAMLGEEVRQWDTELAMKSETALLGKCPLVEAVRRHLKVEAFAQLDYCIAIILWHVRKYWHFRDFLAKTW